MTSYNKFLIWTKKGGCGKTNIAAELILRLQYPAVTNEPETMLSHIMPSNALLILEKNQDVPNINHDVIFDFGGYIDFRIIEVLKQVKYVIVPTLPETSEIQGCISTIQSLKQYTNNIIVIANKTDHKNDFEMIKSAIRITGDYHVFEIKKSRALPNIYIEKKSIAEMVETSRISAFHYGKVNQQFEDIVGFIVK